MWINYTVSCNFYEINVCVLTRGSLCEIVRREHIEVSDVRGRAIRRRHSTRKSRTFADCSLRRTTRQMLANCRSPLQHTPHARRSCRRNCPAAPTPSWWSPLRMWCNCHTHSRSSAAPSRQMDSDWMAPHDCQPARRAHTFEHLWRSPTAPLWQEKLSFHCCRILRRKKWIDFFTGHHGILFLH